MSFNFYLPVFFFLFVCDDVFLSKEATHSFSFLLFLILQVVHPKSDQQRHRLAEAVKNIFIFRSLDPVSLSYSIYSDGQVKGASGRSCVHYNDVNHGKKRIISNIGRRVRMVGYARERAPCSSDIKAFH